MRAAQTPFIEGLVAEEIRRFVAEAISNGNMISTSKCVTKINAVYPNCGISARRMADEIMMAAAAAGVAVEIGVIDASIKDSARHVAS
jgi:hypothetical protein